MSIVSTISIDPEKCIHCGVCVSACPVGIIEMQGQDAAPAVSLEREPSCMKCGHCEAACPEEAVTVNTPDAKDIAYNPDVTAITPEQMGHLMRFRRSIRNFKSSTVDKKILEDLMDIVRFAPTGMNSQSVNWLIVYDPDEVFRLTGLVVDWMRDAVKQNSPILEHLPLDGFIEAWDNGLDLICRKAPHLVVTHAHNANPIGNTDALIALTYLELAVPTFGLGVCWAGIFNMAVPQWPPLKEALGIPADHDVTGSLMLGFPKFKYHRIPRRNPANITWK
jgi:nitroreductase/NAD-dependent dihydropyrimidine dehydrogenase PreA subunit